MANKKKTLSRRKIAFLWIMAVGIGMAVLIAYEQIAVLYLVTTLALVVLLLVVAFADLESVGLSDGDDTVKRF